MTLNSLMSGGYEPDIDLSIVTDFEIWLDSLSDEERQKEEEQAKA